MPRPLLPPSGIYIPTAMIYHREFSPTVIHTWIQLRGLAWGRDETPQISMLQLSELTGKSRSTLFGHMALLRSWGALRWRSSEVGTLIVTFPADTGEFFLDGDSLPSPGESEFPESENLEKLYPSLTSPINQLDINAVEERERENHDLDPEIKQLDLSRGLSPTLGGGGIVQESGHKFENPDSPRDVLEGMDRGTGEIQISGINIALPPDLIDADPIQIYKSLTGIRPNKPQREQLKALINDTVIWYASVEHWQSHGWNPKNIVGILQLYQRGGPSGCRYCSEENVHQDKSLSALHQLRDEIKEPPVGSS